MKFGSYWKTLVSDPYDFPKIIDSPDVPLVSNRYYVTLCIEGICTNELHYDYDNATYALMGSGNNVLF